MRPRPARRCLQPCPASGILIVRHMRPVLVRSRMSCVSPPTVAQKSSEAASAPLNRGRAVCLRKRKPRAKAGPGSSSRLRSAVVPGRGIPPSRPHAQRARPCHRREAAPIPHRYSMYVENAKDNALYYCEKDREEYGITGPCEILAVGNNIVWEEETVRSK